MSESIVSPISVTNGSVRTLDKVCREDAQETLMDRVLVTPVKKGRPHRRFTSRSKPNAPLHPLRHHSQRSSSGHAFAPYPKRNSALNTAVENPPKTPKNKLRRTFTDRSFFINSTISEGALSVTKRRLIGDSRSPSKQSKRSSKSSCKRIKPFNTLLTTASSDLGLPGSPTHRETDLDSDMILMEAKHSNQDMDIALDFQALHLVDHNATLAVDLDGRSPSGHGRKALNLLVTRLRTALAAETKARNEAERRLVRETQRRIEMEELVAQLQRERDELSLNQHSSASSPPPLLSSSPCISPKSAINSALPLLV